MGMGKAAAAGALVIALAMAVAGCKASQTGPDATSATRLADGSDGADWAGYGRSDGQQHYSPLDDVNLGSVSRLGLAWSLDLPLGNTASEPIAIDGVLYFATGLSIVHAVDAATGRELWVHDPEVGMQGGLNQRFGWGVRGLAWWNGKLFVGTRDGRLIALDARTGRQAWSAQTYDKDAPAAITGAPRAFGGRILIGSGSSTGAMRGYVAAYDAETGRELWRFHTVPGNPADGFENATMEMAAKTWGGEWWKFGGGAMVWNSMAWDAETDTVYIGTGSPYPYDHTQRSAGKGDNLFVASIVALDGKTGAYKWHYQTSPGDDWDYDATMDIDLAELEIGGRLRKVLMQAPKNGFFYVLDRQTGELLAANPFVPVTWASRIDLKTGRPVENPQARYDRTGKPVVLTPSPLAAHNWLPMAYSPKARVAYIPVNHWEVSYGPTGKPFVAATDRNTDAGIVMLGGPLAGMSKPTGGLLAFDPVSGRKLWEVPYPTYINGGVLATAGGLVFQGTIDGTFKAFDGATGKVAWSFAAGAPLMAPPITYRAGGRQYVTLLTGLGMAYPMNAGAIFGPEIERYAIDPLTQARRVLTFALDGKAGLPPAGKPAVPPADPGFVPDGARAAAGGAAFSRHCATCHGELGVGIGHAPDLRRSGVIHDAQVFASVVHDGALAVRGMPPFAEFPAGRIEDIRHFLRLRAGQLRAGVVSGTPAPASLQIR